MQNEIIEFEAITNLTYDKENPLHVLITSLMEQENKVREGNEGVSSINLNGISENYIDNYSKRVCRLLDSVRRRVRFL